MENNKLLPINQTLVIAQTGLVLNMTQKLTLNQNRKLLKEIFIRNPELFINLISSFYPLKTEFLEIHIDKWNWTRLSRNKNLPWSINLFEKHIKNWKLVSLMYSNDKLLTTEGFIDKYADKINWNLFSSSINFTSDLIKRFYNKCKWDGLSGNKNLPWSVEFFEEHIDKWNWEHLSRNENLPWSSEFFEKHIDKWNWVYLSSNKNLPWSSEFFEKHIDKWNWKNLSRIENLPWSIDFFERHIDKWDWENLSRNENLPWTVEFFEKHMDKWDWKNLSYNEKLPWSIEFFEKYIDKWYWIGLSWNTSLPWSVEFFEKHIEKWSWQPLSCNENLPLTINFIHKYAEKWTASLNIWEAIIMYIDDQLIEEIINDSNKGFYGNSR